ncbi:class I SAM-dependent methyltransferase [Candidatus Laterigemmans baculatus]|uniref:class I SAM-dependent methyltransferase n=1 Tax=Candidatus Laterigemmans baculatus TaxID=2770505 RepID=UPI001F27139B|nr:class I SAM-dependent methyltransferase [Candidatus Laterigemmans baculatus]
MKLENWYDYPQYFDLVFRDETPAELDFFEAAFERFADGPVRTLYEPGCGSGRLVVGMAARGYQVTGLDLNRPSLDYLRRKLRRRKLAAEVVEGDMVDFQPPQPFDAAFCTFNSFRHLTAPGDAERHLESVAASLRPGGLYILGFHIIPLDADEECTERWRAAHGGTSVSVTLKVIEFDRSRRQEQIRVSLLARSGDKTVRCRTEYPQRLYTASQVAELFAAVPTLEVAGIFDFDYDIDQPRELDDDLTDALFVLRRK